MIRSRFKIPYSDFSVIPPVPMFFYRGYILLLIFNLKNRGKSITDRYKLKSYKKKLKVLLMA